MKYNVPLQNKNCLKNFDLSEYRQIISDLAIRVYHQFITVMENNLQPMIGKEAPWKPISFKMANPEIKEKLYIYDVVKLCMEESAVTHSYQKYFTLLKTN